MPGVTGQQVEPLLLDSWILGGRRGLEHLIHEGAHVVPTWGRVHASTLWHAAHGAECSPGQDSHSCREMISYAPGGHGISSALPGTPWRLIEFRPFIPLKACVLGGRGRHRAHRLSWGPGLQVPCRKEELAGPLTFLTAPVSLILSQLSALVLPQLHSL